MLPRVTSIEATYGPAAMLKISVQLEQLTGPGGANPVLLAAELSLDLVAAGKGVPTDRTSVFDLGRHRASLSSERHRVVFDVRLGAVGVTEIDRRRQEEQDVWLEGSVWAQVLWVGDGQVPKWYAPEFSNVVQNDKHPGLVKIPWSEWVKYKEAWWRHQLLVEIRDLHLIHDVEDIAEKYSVDTRDIVDQAVRALVEKEKAQEQKDNTPRNLRENAP
jgi:hypothetical protein